MHPKSRRRTALIAAESASACGICIAPTPWTVETEKRKTLPMPILKSVETWRPPIARQHAALSGLS